MTLYDDFSSPALDASRWAIARVPLGNDNYWYYKDEEARLTCGGGHCIIDIPRFTAKHDQVQIFDNPKHLYLATTSWATDRGQVAFSTTLAAEVTGEPDDYRDGFASFNVLDFESALVLDIIANGHHVWAIYERLLIPGVTTAEEAFTEVVELAVETAPMKEHECRIEYDAERGRALWFVDGEERLVREGIPVTASRLTIGFGIITLHEIRDGKSTSCRGQGGKGRWGAFQAGT